MKHTLIRLILVLLTILAVTGDKAAAQRYVCGDADGSGTIDANDMIYILNYLLMGGPAPDPVDAADVDSISGVTNNDLAFLTTRIFAGGSAPYCPPFPDSILSVTDDTVKILSTLVLPGVDACTVKVWLDADEPVHGVSLPFSFSCSTSAVSLDTISFDGSVGFSTEIGAVDNSIGKGLIGTMDVFSGHTEGLLASLHFSLTPSADTQYILIDTSTYVPSNTVVFSRLDGTEIIAFIPTIVGLIQTQEPELEATIEVLTSGGWRSVHYNMMQIDTLDGESVRVLLPQELADLSPDSITVHWANDFFVPTDSFLNITDSFPNLLYNFADTAVIAMGAGNVHFWVRAYKGYDTVISTDAIMLAYDDPDWPVMSVTDSELVVVGSGDAQMLAASIVVSFDSLTVAGWGTPDSADLAMAEFFRENLLMPIGVCRNIYFIHAYIYDESFSLEDSAAITELADTLYENNSELLDEAMPNLVFQSRAVTAATEDFPKETRDDFTIFRINDDDQLVKTKPEGHFFPLENVVLANYFRLFLTEAYAGHRLARKAANIGSISDVWLAVMDDGFGKGTLPVPGIANSRIKKPTRFSDSKNKVISYADDKISEVKDLGGSHGTQVAISAVGDGKHHNGVVRGTGPDVILMPFKDGVKSYFEIIAFLKYIMSKEPAKSNVKVINFSHSGWSKKAETLKKVVKAVCASGRVLVVATDNKERDITNHEGKFEIPTRWAPEGKRNSHFSTLIAVTATDGTDKTMDGKSKPTVGTQERKVKKAGFGKPISLAAPGRNIRVQDRDGFTSIASGTSFATPQVSGLIGEMMMLDKALGNPDFSPQQIVEIVELTADSVPNHDGANYGKPLSPGIYTGHGRINVWKALLAVANVGVSSWDTDSCGKYYGALVDSNVKNDAKTTWYGFKIHTEKQNATAWLKTASANPEQIEDVGNPDELEYGVKMKYPTAYKGVQRTKNMPASLPFGYSTIKEAGGESNFLMLFSIKRDDLKDGNEAFKQLWLKDPKGKWIRKYPKSGGMNLATMRTGSVKGISFEHFIFTMDFIKLKIKKLLGTEKELDTGDTLNSHFDLIISNPDTLRDTVTITVEAYLNGIPFAEPILETMEVSIPPADTILAESLHVHLPLALTDSDTVQVIATVEPFNGDYMCRDIYYEAAPYLCGDADGSGGVDIDDVVFLIAYIFSGGPPPVPIESGDADCSGDVDIDDVVWLIAYIFSGGYAPCDTDGDDVPDC